MEILLDKNKKFYKANLHTHTTMSDGRLSVEKQTEEFKKRGYSIVAFTDHEHLIDNSHLDDDEFLTITSCEMAIKEFSEQSTLKNFDMRVCHLNFYALDQQNTITPCYSSVYNHYINDENRNLIHYDGEYEREYSLKNINEMIRIANEKGFIVSYNHPSWSLENATHYLGYEGLFAVEIYNNSCVKSGGVDDESVFDDMLRFGKKLYCTACDDCHNTDDLSSPYSDAFGGWVEINAQMLEYDEIMRALVAGEFYASTGPQIISLVKDGKNVKIETSKAKKISIITRGRRTKSYIADEGEYLTSAEFQLRDTDGFFRIRVEDEKGKKAYTQSYDV